MWKDIRFLITHAESRLKKIDEELYKNEGTKKYRICHLHLNAFDDDTAPRLHTHNFNTNVLKIVPHSYQSEQNQNAIKNYVEYRKTNVFQPKNMGKWETKMWRISDYKNIFIQNMFFFFILCFLVAAGCAAAVVAFFFWGGTGNILVVALVAVAFLVLSPYHD